LKQYNDDLKPLEIIRFALSMTIVIWHFQNFFYPVSPDNWNIIRERQPLYTYFKWCYDNGLIAVQFFWFISGIIFFRVYEENISNRKIGWSTFIYNRFSRLYPLHLVTLLFVLFLQIIYFSKFGIYFMTPISGVDFIKHLFFVHSWNNQNFSFNAPVWSVSVEIVVYFLFFFFAISGFIRKISFTILTVLVVVIIKRLNLVFYYDILNCLYFFMIGGLLIKCYDSLRSKLKEFAWVVFVLVLFVLLERFSIFNMPSLWNLSIRTLFFSFFIVFPAILIFKYIKILKSISHIKFTNIGNLTYSTYLLHFPIQLFLATFFVSPKSEILFSTRFFLLYLGIVIVTSIFAYNFIEKPCKAFLRKYRN
jgi:peptidoglycan/LPS O-acetylase OafA/YrhL